MDRFIFKAIAIGDGRVGKTSIIRRYVHQKFDPEYKATIGVAHAMKKLFIKDKTLTLTIWDTAGQELFERIRPHYYRGANGALVVYDTTSRESFDHLDNWFTNVHDYSGEIPIILIGNKIDLVEDRVITTEEGEQYALEKGAMFYETSAKTGKMVTDVLEQLARLMLSVVEKSKRKENK